MKRKLNGMMLFLAITYILTGCQKRDAAEIKTEIERAEESVSESAQGMTETVADGGDYDFGTDDFGATFSETDMLDAGTDAFHAGTSDTETTDPFDADSPGTNSDGAEESDKERSVPDVADSFYYIALTDEIKARITGKSYPDTDEPLQISYEDLAYVHVLHYDFQAQIQEGELICNQSIAQDLVEIFYELYENQYPVEKIRLIDEYDADDEASMEDNNTSCFNYRTVPGRTTLSNHSYGCAIDINPLYNPYVRTSGGKELISPDNAVPYADRSADFPYKIDKNDLCYRIFIEHGFSWGGSWNSSKDYQHFEKVS